MSSMDIVSGLRQAQQQQDEPKAFLTQDERDVVKRLLAFPEEFPPEFGTWLVDYLGTAGAYQQYQVQGLPLLNSQVQTSLNQIDALVTQVAADQVTVSVDSVLTEETRTTDSSFYAALGTAGPSLSGLTNGSYLVIISCVARSASSGYSALMSVSVNGGAASDSNAAIISNTSNSSGFSMFTASLASGSNTLTALYKSSNGVIDATFSNRRMAALRIGA